MIRTEPVSCEHMGTYLEGFARIPEGPGPHPVVVIIHGGNGLFHIVPRTADRLAEAGYLAVAADMVGPEAHKAGARRVQEASAIFGDQPLLARERTAAWVEAAAALPRAAPGRIAAIGYCFGGHCVLELARGGSDVKAVVSFHGILTTRTPAAAGAVRTEVAVYTGSRDPYVPQEHVDALRKEFTDADASFSITTFSRAEHAFTDPDAAALSMPGLAHDPVADRVSWDGMMALLQLKLR